MAIVEGITTSEERLWRWYHLGEENEEDQSRDGWTVSTKTREPSERRKMKSMTELVAGELCLPQRPHHQVGPARRRRRSAYACIKKSRGQEGTGSIQKTAEEGRP